MTRAEAKQIALKHCNPSIVPADMRGLVIGIMPGTRGFISDIVAVQPMTEPSGHVFYMDFCCNSRWERLKRWLRQAVRRLSTFL